MPEPTTRPSPSTGRALHVLLADGGTAGHVNPLLATADALRTHLGQPEDSARQEVEILVLGTKEGLEDRLVPEAGYPLAHVPRVPLPRRPSADLVMLPRRLTRAVGAAEAAIERVGADVVVGFGGYVATPAYLAARRRGVPVVIHEQNARPGLANKLGASWARAVALTFASTPLTSSKGRTEVTGLPLRPAIAGLVERRARAEGAAAARGEGAAALGLDPGRPTLLVTGGSLGAQHLNEVATAALDALPEGIQVLHLTGRGKNEPVQAAVDRAGLGERYHVLEYLSTMEDAYACADAVLCRSGAGTVAELTALGLPALYVPLPIGNGEQRLNASDVVEAGGGTVVADADLGVGDVAGLYALVADREALGTMAERAAATGVRDGAARLARLIREVAHEAREGEDER